MNEIEYILRILLKARDETAAAFRSAREQLRLFVNAADDGSKKLDKFNASMATMEKNMDGVTRKIREWRAVIQGLGDDNDESAKSIARIGKETDSYVKTTQRAVRSQKDLAVQASRSREEFKKFEQQVKNGNHSNDDAISGYQRLGKELDQVSNKLNIGTRNWQRTREWARIAKENAQQIIAASKAESDAYVENTRRESVAAEETAKRKKAAYDNALADLRSAVSDEIKVTRDGKRVTTQIERDAEVERRRIVAERARSEATEAAERLKFTQLQESAASRAARAQSLLGGRGRADPAGINQLRELRKEYDQLSRHTRSSADEQNHFAREAESVGRTLRKLEGDGRKSTSVFDRMAQAFHNNSRSIAGFDNSLRSLGILLIAGFAQQLITVLGGLAGSFVALAGSAAEAGAAIGGIFVAGVMQALPVIGLLGAAFAQVKSVIQAVKQAQLERQQASVQGQAADRRTADAADAVASAQEGAADAQRRLKESQESLTEARKKAREDLQDLIVAENNAKLAAVGAALSQAEAQKQLIAAQATGDVQGIQRAQLGVLQAQADAHDKITQKRRASAEAQKAERGGVEGMPGVVDAKKQLDDAERSVTKANRGLEAAKRNAREAAAGTETAAHKLQFLLSQMTEGQRKLFFALEDLRKTYLRVFGSITDIILASFTHLVRRLNVLLQLPELLQGARRLATEISTQLNRIFDAVTSDKMVAQFLRIAEEARKNLAPVTTIIINLAKSFANIGEAGGPAFRNLIGFVGDLADKFLKITENRKGLTDFFVEGEKHFEAWVNLGLAVIQLFAALTGAGGASSGLKTVQDATKGIDDLTQKVKDNKESVKNFFEDARKVTYQVFSVVRRLAEELFKAFSPKRVENFVKLLNDTVIPALGNAIDFLGQITNLMLEFADTKFGGEILKGIVALLIVGKIGQAVFSPFFKLVEGLLKILPKLIPGFEGVAAAVEGMGAGAILATVGWAILIAAVIAGVIIILNHLGLLDDAVGIIKDAFNEFWKQVEPSLGKLATAAEDFWDALAKGKGLAAILRPLIKLFLDIGGVFLNVFGRLMGRELGGIIDIITGVIQVITALLTGDWRKAWEGAKNIVRGAVRAFTAPFRALPELLWGLLRGTIRRVARALSDLAESFGSWAKRAAGNFMHFLRELPGQIGDFFSKLPGRIRDFGSSLVRALGSIGKSAAKAFVDAFKNVGQDIISGITRGFKDASGFAKDIANAFIDLLNNLLPNKIAVPGAPDINLPDNPIHHLAAGGPVPGSGRGDSVRALLEPGEHVFTRQEVAAFGGHAAVFALRRALGGGGQGSGGRFQAGGATAGAGSLTIDFHGGDLNAFKSQWREFWNSLVTSARRGANSIEAQFRDLRVNTARSADLMYRRIRGSIADIQHSFDARGNRITSNWSDTWDSLTQIAFNGLNYIGHQTNLALKGLDEKHVDFGLTAPKKSESKASGGFIGRQGQHGRDRGLYPLGAGEAVLNWAHQKYVAPAVEHYYGHPFSETFNRVRGYHAGGKGDTLGYAGGREGTAALFDGHPSNVVSGIISILRILKKRFPGLVVTSTRDHGATTSTGGISDHPSGHAVDIGGPLPLQARAVEYIKSSGIAKRLKQGIHDPGLAINLGKPVSGPGFYSVAWPQHIDHIHLAMAGALGAVADVISSVGRQIVSGPDGALKTIVQKALDLSRTAANKFIDDKSASGMDTSAMKQPGAGQPAPPGQHRRWIVEGLKLAGVPPTPANVNAQYALDMGESGGNPKIIQQIHDINSVTGNLARGIAQMIPPTFSSYAVKGHGDIFNPVDNIAASARYQISRYHQLVGHPGYAAGGIVPGPPGKPVPIMAHAREWILNEGQVNRLSSMVGVSRDALRSMMGFYGGSGGAQGGTEVQHQRILQIGDSLSVGMEKALKQMFDHVTSYVRVGRGSEEAFKILRDKLTSAYKAVIFDVGTNDAQASVLTKNLRRAYGELSKGQELIVSRVTGPGAKEKNKAIEEFAKAHQNVSVVAAATKKEVSGDPQGIHLTTEGYKKRAKKFADAIKKNSKEADTAATDAEQILNLTTEEVKKIHNRSLRRWIVKVREVARNFDVAAVGLGDVESWTRYFHTFTSRLGEVSKRITRRLSAADAEKGLRGFADAMDNMLGDQGVFAKLRASIERTTAAIARRMIYGTTASRFTVGAGRFVSEQQGQGTAAAQAEALLIEQRRQRGVLTDEQGNISASLTQVTRQLRRRGIDPKVRQRLVGEQTKLQGMLDDAEQRVADNVQAIFDAQEAFAQAQLDAQQKIVDNITSGYERLTAGTERASRFGAALGREDLIDQASQAQRDYLTQQADALEGRIASIRALGTDDANKLADQLTDQVADLRLQVFEAIQQQIADMADRVNAAAQRSSARLDLAGRMLDALGVVGLTGAAGSFGLSRSAIGAQRGGVLQTQRAGLQGVLGQAQAQGNVKLINDLTAQIEELDVTIAENTKAVFDARVTEVTSRHDYTQSMIDLNLQLNELDGTINGQVDQAAKLALLTDKQNDLIAKGLELSALLSEATPGTQQYLDLQKSILENTVAQRQNTVAVNEATGATQQPQTFSTSAWQWFREAIFSGMGQVLPQYDTSLMTGVNTGAMIVPGMTSNQTVGGNVSLTINEAGGPVDIQAVTSAITFLSKTAQ